jgi:hypothetical protein
MWFWNRAENARAATILLLPLLLALQVTCVLLHTTLGPLGAGLFAGAGTYFAFGALERWIRHACRKRALGLARSDARHALTYSRDHAQA